MSERGVIGVARSIWDDPEFKPEPFTEREAFMWLVSEAAWKDREVRGPNGPVTLQRGEFCHSVRFMANRWKWSKSRVARFISMLKKRDTLRDTVRDSNQVYYIKNYNKYQIVGLPDRDSAETRNGTAAGQQRDSSGTNEKKGNIKTYSVPNGTGVPPEFPDQRKQVFDIALPSLKAQGHDERSARSIIGGWRKRCGNDDAYLLGKLVAAGKAQPANLVEWMAKAVPRGATGFGAALDSMDEDLGVER